jgi:hypothetical protein
MKTKILLLIILSLGVASISKAQQSTTIYTPKGTSLTAWTNIPAMSQEQQTEWYNWVVYTYPQADIIGAATNDYNCHGFAWHYSESTYPVWIGLEEYDPNPYTVEDIYWTDGSYIETTEPYASKISYYQGNHSAIQTSTQGVYISKWGSGPLVQHANNYGPAGYQMNSRKYYKLNPQVLGSTAPMCSVQNRTFSSNINMTGATYTWTYSSSNLNYISGAGTTNFTIQSKSGESGYAWVQLQITAPSGKIATSQALSFWLGSDLPDPVVLEIKGENYEFVEHTNDMWELCPNTIYRLQAHSSSSISQWEWTIPESWELLSNENSPEILIQTGDYIYWEDEVHVDVYNYGCDTWIYNADYLLVTEPPYGCGEFLQLNLYPNPATNSISIQIIGNENYLENINAYSINISIIDKSGRVLINKVTKVNLINLDISDLQKGEYTVVTTIGKQVKSLRFIKSN